jgi:hypothetical protein
MTQRYRQNLKEWLKTGSYFGSDLDEIIGAGSRPTVLFTSCEYG